MSDKNKAEKNAASETTISIDYGNRNIGIAFGRNGLVKPIKVISGKNDYSAISEISRYVLENKINNIVMGLPLSIEGKENEQSRKVRRFSKLLKIRLKKPINFVNEYKSTKDSVTTAINLGISKKRRRVVDHLSAALILKTYYSNL